MKEFDYIVNDELGIHARPAGQLAKLAKGYADTVITITKGDKTVKATQLMKLMNLCVKQGATVTVKVEGPQEEEAFAEVQKFFNDNL